MRFPIAPLNSQYQGCIKIFYFLGPQGQRVHCFRGTFPLNFTLRMVLCQENINILPGARGKLLYLYLIAFSANLKNFLGPMVPWSAILCSPDSIFILFRYHIHSMEIYKFPIKVHAISILWIFKNVSNVFYHQSYPLPTNTHISLFSPFPL